MWEHRELGRSVRAAVVALLLAILSACTEYQPLRPLADGAQASRGASLGREGAGRHLVMEGETLSELAQRYRVSMSRLASLNGIRKPYPIYVGQVLALPAPAATRLARAAEPKAQPRRQTARLKVVPASRPEVAAPPVLVAIAEPEPAPVQDEASREATRKAAETKPPPLTGDGFLWPVSGRLIDRFGEKPNGTRNDGINIGASAGTTVRAAEGGVVVYAGSSIPGFGRMLLVRHADGFTTAYAHNESLNVGVGDIVARGQAIAAVGNTGDVSAPQLHFELRLGAKPVDPTRHLVDGDTELASSSPTS